MSETGQKSGIWFHSRKWSASHLVACCLSVVAMDARLAKFALTYAPLRYRAHFDDHARHHLRTACAAVGVAPARVPMFTLPSAVLAKSTEMDSHAAVAGCRPGWQ